MFKDGPPTEYNEERRHYMETYFETLPSGRISKRVSYQFYYFTPLNKCDLCGKVSTPKRVQLRGDCWYWFLEKRTNRAIGEYIRNISGSYDAKDMLCMSCWNKVRIILNKESLLKKSGKEVNNLKLVIRDEKKRIKNDCDTN